jgi:hypothetical protein
MALNKLTTALTVAGALVLSNGSQAQEKAGHDKDYRTFYQNGKIDYGKIADSYTADLVLYLAGNQFMVMEELVQDFLGKHSNISSVYVETIPPGQI